MVTAGYPTEDSFQSSSDSCGLANVILKMSGGRVAFGSSQERKLFPLHLAPDRLGLQMHRDTSPHLGPACHYNQNGTISYVLEKKPESKRGYVLARTADRFPPIKTVTSLPLWYQPDQSKTRVPPPGKTPFSSTDERFKSTPCVRNNTPGPGTYTTQEAATNRKVSWPMCFGRPDWSRLPPIETMLQVKLTDEKALVKQRNRLAYLSLYY